MPQQKHGHDLRDLLIDAHAHFFIIKGHGASRLRLWQILPEGIIIDMPKGASMHRTVLGYVPTLDGKGVYEIDGRISPETLPDQLEGTVLVEVDPSRVKRVNRRVYPRVSFTPPIKGTAEVTGQKPHTISIINMSAGGLRIQSSSALDPAQPFRFRFVIETEDEVHRLNLQGAVVYELPAEKGHLYGVRFGELSEEAELEGGEAPVEALDATIDLLELVNRLLVHQG